MPRESEPQSRSIDETKFDLADLESVANGATELLEAGHLSDGQFNAVIAASRRFKEGNATQNDLSVLRRIRQSVEWTREREEHDRLIQSQLIAEVGHEGVQQIDSIAHDLVVALKRHLLRAHGAAATIELWRALADRLCARAASESPRDPARVEAALNAARREL